MSCNLLPSCDGRTGSAAHLALTARSCHHANSSSSLVLGADGKSVAVSALREGDLLRGSEGMVTVERVTPGTAPKRMYTIRDGTGRSITVTADHLVTLSWRRSPKVSANTIVVPH